MNGRYNKFYRCGGSTNSNLESIYNALKTAVGTAYDTRDDASLKCIELYAYAKELDAIQDFCTYLGNRANPKTCNSDFLSEIQKQLGYLVTNVDNNSIRDLCQYHYEVFKNIIRVQLLHDMLVKLAPDTYDKLFFPRSTQFDQNVQKPTSLVYNPTIDSSLSVNIDWTTGVNYLGNRIRLLHPEIESESNPIIDGSSTNGFSYSYETGYTDRWSDLRFTLIVFIKNIGNTNFGVDLNVMKLFLNKFLPVHLSFTFAENLGFTLAPDDESTGSSLDGYDCLS